MSDRKKYTLNCIPIGSSVKIGVDKDSIDAVVIGICLKGVSDVTYEVAWWNGAARNTAWVTPEEIFSGSDETLTIGFYAEAQIR